MNRNPIPEEQAVEIRRFSHELSNALEIIVQTNYLLGLASLEPNAAEWQKMLDQGVRQASQINRELREYIRSHSSSAIDAEEDPARVTGNAAP